MRDQVKNKYFDMDETIDSVNKLMNGIRDLISIEPIQTSICHRNCSSLLENCEEIRGVLNQKAEMIDRITFDYAMDKLPIIQDYVESTGGEFGRI